MKITFSTLGCKLNQAETELLARRFAEEGHTIVSSIEEADIFVLNTCTVTHIADAKSRQLLRKARRRNPGIILTAIGCYAHRAPEILADIDGVMVTAGNPEKTKLVEILEKSGFLPEPGLYGPGNTVNDMPISRTRSFIKIQDGCSNFCSYCIVPFVRGSETSIPADEVIDEINRRVEQGIREVVITGTEIGSYVHEETDLRGLLKRVLEETSVQRIRLSSLQPDEITAGFLSLWNDPRLCPHFHLSLQSGSDTVLERMNRRYRTGDYRKAVSLIRCEVTDTAITTDIIAGFPGETEQEYRESLEMCRETGFARIHVFPYSKRPGTVAASMPDQVPDSIRTQRNQNLGALSTECAETYRREYIGRDMDVLWEQRSGGIWSGYTGNYIRVFTRDRADLTNTITPVRLEKLYKDGLWGSAVEPME